MLIDWFTVAAQAVNFLILVWLLKRFLYKPILDAIDAREKRIASELADADAKRVEASKEREEFQQKNRAFDQQRQSMLTKAANDANSERQRLLADAKNAAETMRANRDDALHREHVALSKEVTCRTQTEVFAIARKALTDLANLSLEEQITDVFIRRLQELDDDEKADFAGPSDAQDNSMIVRSAFDLPTAQRAKLQDAINRAFSMEVALTFETVPDVISGIELTSSGRKISWSIVEYLSSMEKRIGELLQDQSQPVSKSDPQPQKKTG
ncbi:F0F1 ATP synthase subunit B family protein [Rubripirellula reticaptiva]|uniref:ATP synthase subunit b n=1 Tax=Rubripirellula reticaptiva TaxID=2528013 RepID=A0A5C6EAV6_9BACT|nr:F0F1 ATP synthase subunit B [Rubripirellula reticaptiva]TWU46873.1 ATP synthase subunit b [Rubripirellula reticaptiva]